MNNYKNIKKFIFSSIILEDYIKKLTDIEFYKLKINIKYYIDNYNLIQIFIN